VTKSLNAVVTFFVFRKQNKKFLTLNLLEVSSPSFNHFEYHPSNGASGVVLIAWHGDRLRGSVVFQNTDSL
jgi:hypothetical protein